MELITSARALVVAQATHVATSTQLAESLARFVAKPAGGGMSAARLMSHDVRMFPPDEVRRAVELLGEVHADVTSAAANATAYVTAQQALRTAASEAIAGAQLSPTAQATILTQTNAQLDRAFGASQELMTPGIRTELRTTRVGTVSSTNMRRSEPATTTFDRWAKQVAEDLAGSQSTNLVGDRFGITPLDRSHPRSFSEARRYRQAVRKQTVAVRPANLGEHIARSLEHHVRDQLTATRGAPIATADAIRGQVDATMRNDAAFTNLVDVLAGANATRARGTALQDEALTEAFRHLDQTDVAPSVTSAQHREALASGRAAIEQLGQGIDEHISELRVRIDRTSVGA